MRRAPLSLLVAAVIAIAAVSSAAGGAGVPAAKGGRLQPFASCAQLLRHVKARALPLVGPYGFASGGAKDVVVGIGAPEAARSAVAPGGGGVAGVDFSTTNAQEEGVDEPDIVKSDGTTLFVVRANRLLSVDIRSSAPRLSGSLELEPGWSHELLLSGQRLLVLSRGGGPVTGRPSAGVRFAPVAQQTILSEVDIGRPASMRVVRSLKLDAGYVSARLVGSSARVVTVSLLAQKVRFEVPTEPTAAAAAAAKARNRAVVRASPVGAWLPTLAVRGRRGETLKRKPLVQCTDVSRPAAYSGLGLLSVLTLDLRKGLAPVDSDAVLTDGNTVYASQGSLYVATQRFVPQPAGGPIVEPPQTSTAIHRFDISDPQRTVYRGSGVVSGYLLNQWSLSEHAGVLRVVSTEQPSWWSANGVRETETSVTTLRDRNGSLVRIGRVGGLGKGERVFAVRFVGDQGYVVTFRQVDPLYVLDLAQPSRPRVAGELKILGYSAYLHPIGDDLLLGIGQDATPEGRRIGAQAAVFDVRDPRRPVRLHVRPLGPGFSAVEWDHHAFLWWGPQRLAVLPVDGLAGESGSAFSGAVGLRAGRSALIEVGRISHPVPGPRPTPGTARIERTLVAGSIVYSVSQAGVRASDLGTLADRGWLAFPQAPPRDAPADGG
jgi:Beta propeller domain